MPGTVVGPTDLTLALESSAIDLVVARGVASPETKLVFSVAGSKQLTVTKKTTIAARVKVSRPADVTATLYSAGKQRLYTWHVKLKPGANVVKLQLPSQIRRPGAYTLTWVARSGTQTIRHTVKLTARRPQARAGQAEAQRDRGRARGRRAAEDGRSSRPSPAPARASSPRRTRIRRSH